MTEPVRTRAEVEREVRETLGYAYSVERTRRVSAALLAMAECECECHHDPDAFGGGPHLCACHGTGLDQARLAHGLKALEER